jgi:hypothetical protein
MVGEGPTYAAHRTVQPSQDTFFFKLGVFSGFSLYIIHHAGRSREAAMGWGGGAHSALFCELKVGCAHAVHVRVRP